MRVCTPAEMQALEAHSKIPEEILMENAGSAAAREIQTRYWPELKRGRVVIVCGPGHNGADGLVIARHLVAAGAQRLVVYAVEPLAAAKPSFKTQWSRLAGCDKREAPAAMDWQGVSLIVDAIYGTGFHGEFQSSIAQAIGNSGALVVAIDTPSGLEGDSGQAAGHALKAALTLTFGFPKLGFFTAKGAALCGQIRVLPIGFPKGCYSTRGNKYFLFNHKWAKRWLPARPPAANKSTFGHVAVCAGRPGFWGAGVLATQAAYRLGAGYVTWASETEAPLAELRSNPETLTMSLSDVMAAASGVTPASGATAGRRSVDGSTLSICKFKAWVVGPGLGTDGGTARLLEAVRATGQPAVIDADALTVLAKGGFGKIPANWILTPHSGEMARLLECSATEIESNRFAAVARAQEKLGGVIVLKGYRTLIQTAGRCLILPTGNPALAKAGTGDVLAGFIGGLLAQGLSPWKAASLAAYVHGSLADEWVASGKDISSLVASDLAAGLPELLQGIRRGQLRSPRTIY